MGQEDIDLVTDMFIGLADEYGLGEVRYPVYPVVGQWLYELCSMVTTQDGYDYYMFIRIYFSGTLDIATMFHSQENMFGVYETIPVSREVYNYIKRLERIGYGVRYVFWGYGDTCNELLISKTK